MHTIIKNVLSAAEIHQLKELLNSSDFVDGRKTSSLLEKNNLQLDLNSETSSLSGNIVISALLANEEFRNTAYPAIMHPPLFSKYDVGMEYPDHVDVALMGRIRADIALTLFLSRLDDYDGGELVVDTGNGLHSYRLEAGSAVVYPASTVHHVRRVTQGVRLAAVLWVQSRIPDPLKREILHDLASSMSVYENSFCGALLRRSYWNLVRMWADTTESG